MRVCFAQLLAGWIAYASCIETLRADEQKATSHSTVLARTGDQTIVAADIDFFLGRNGNENLVELPTSVRENAIQLLALQRQALMTLRMQKLVVADSEVDHWIRSQAGPTESEKTIDEILQSLCQRRCISEEKLREHVQFRLSWPRYLEKHLTEENLKKHFARQHARFDGSKFKIDRVSMRVPAGDSKLRIAARARLQQLRTVFLVEEQTDDPTLEISRDKWVAGTGDLDPKLITSLLSGMPGEDFSQPLDTATGVHIVRLIEREEGDLPLSKVADDVRAHMLIYLLEHLAKQSEQRLQLVPASNTQLPE